jgi:hypothetical protein
MGALQAVRSNNAFQPPLSVAAVCLQSRSFARWNHFSGSVLIEAGNVIETHEHKGGFKEW